MRFGSSPTLIGSLGTLVQRLVSGVNTLAVSLLGGTFADDVTSSGNAFMGGTGPSAQAAVYSRIQAKNPAGSGKTLFVDSVEITVGSAVATGVQCTLSLSNTDLTGDAGAFPNKDSGGAASASHIRYENSATAADGAALGWVVVPAAVGGSRNVTFDPPIKLGAGEGFNVVCNVLNQALLVSFQVREY